MNGFCNRRAPGNGSLNDAHNVSRHPCFFGRTAVVTGALGYIGTATVNRLLFNGANVFLIDTIATSDSTCAAKIAEFKTIKTTFSHSPVVHYFPTDVQDEASVVRVINSIRDHPDSGSRIDYLFNNAGIQGAFQTTPNYDTNDFEAVMKVNVQGVFHVLKAVSNVMKEQKPLGGSIVNSASCAAQGVPNMLAYSGSKAAVIGMTKTAAKDLVEYDIRVNSISPAYIGDCFMWRRQVQLQTAAGSRFYG